MLTHISSKVILHALDWMQTIPCFRNHKSNSSFQLRTESHLS